MSTNNWSQDGKRLLLGWSPSGGEVANIKATLRVSAHTNGTDFLFLGRDEIARFCETPFLTRLKAYVCQLMAGRAKTPEEKGSLRADSLMHLAMYDQECEAARRAYTKTATGTSGQIRRVWP